MRNTLALAMVIIVAVSFAVPANAQFADDIVQSDSYGNPAAGDFALYALTAKEEVSLGCNTLCVDNTAFGFNARFSNTTGSNNTAKGAMALQDRI